EGYGPGGVALFIDTLTDNRNRTVSEVRHILSKNGGSLGEAGCVAWMFDLRGVITLDAADLDEESAMELVLGAGAEDFSMDDGNCLVYTGPAEVATVREALEADGAKVIAAEQSWIPKNTVEVDAKVAEQTLRLLEALEDQDDVQRVSSNFDISEEVLRSLGE
ncbi:MAG: YebC/PmpR family DNA-binding transcriptional regulator, partial [Gemmatimonadetes bacterium]|nr:YebC/PmpR family DNA-binding transcriptional regulator [Gemmatimonadota bacterium]